MSNEEAIKVLQAIKNNPSMSIFLPDEYDAIDLAIKALEERPKGKWIELPKSLDENELTCKCSVCGHIVGFYYGYPKSNFCPECGADMRGDI